MESTTGPVHTQLKNSSNALDRHALYQKEQQALAHLERRYERVAQQAPPLVADVPLPAPYHADLHDLLSGGTDADRWVAHYLLTHRGALTLSRELGEKLWPELRRRQRGAGETRVAYMHDLQLSLETAGISTDLECKPNPRRSGTFYYVLKATRFPEDLRQSWRDALAGWTPQQREIGLLSGRVWTAADRRAAFRRQREAAEARIEREQAIGDEKRKGIMEYLFRVCTPNTCRFLARDVDEAMKLVNQLYPPPSPEDPMFEQMRAAARRADVLRNLRATLAAPAAAYLPSRNNTTARLFQAGGGFQQLPQAIRRALRPGLTVLDMQAAHLRLAAWQWCARATLGFIARCDAGGHNVWTLFITELLGAAGVAPAQVRGEGLRDALKTLVYSVVYGKSEAGLRRALQQEMRPVVLAPSKRDSDAVLASLSSAFFRHSVIRDLLEARTAQLAKIARERSAGTLWGYAVGVASTDSTAAFYASCRQVIAKQLQQVEMDLLYPVYEYAMQQEALARSEVRVLSHEHDGLGVWFGRRDGVHQKTIEQAILRRAAYLGIPMRITWELPLRDERAVAQQAQGGPEAEVLRRRLHRRWGSYLALAREQTSSIVPETGCGQAGGHETSSGPLVATSTTHNPVVGAVGVSDGTAARTGLAERGLYVDPGSRVAGPYQRSNPH